MIPVVVVEIRREICARCDAPCPAHQAGLVDHADAEASCPRIWSGRWGRYGQSVAPQTQPVGNAPSGAAPTAPILWWPAQWPDLHNRAMARAGQDDTAWLAGFTRRVPCGDCRRHWQAHLAGNPPDWANYFAWSVTAHNAVNLLLGKPEMPLASARMHYALAMHDVSKAVSEPPQS